MESLRERDLGVLEGMTTDEMLQKNPAEYQSFRNDGPEYQVPGGESFRQFYDRCSGALEDVANRNPGKKIGVVTHGGFLRGNLPLCFEYPSRCGKELRITQLLS